MSSPRVLLTAFRPYDDWSENVSWSTLVAITRELPPAMRIETRLYPCDLGELRARIEADLDQEFDYVLHLGQAAGAAAILLERFAVNWFRDRDEAAGAGRPLDPAGPPGYQSAAPLADWTAALAASGAPAAASNHAGDYLCNAALYLSHHLRLARGQRPVVAFLHLPLSVDQAIAAPQLLPCLPLQTTVAAVRALLELVTTARATAL